MRGPVLMIALLLLTACDGPADPLEIAAIGGLDALIYLDANENGEADEGIDRLGAGLLVALHHLSGDTALTAETDGSGTVRILPVPVGTYEVQVAPAELGDTLSQLGPATIVTIPANDIPAVTVRVGFRRATSSELATTTAGKPVSVRGVALHEANAFGDSLLHVLDASGAIRVTGVPARIDAETGDSVLVIGRVGTTQGRTGIVDAIAFVTQAASEAPSPLVVSATDARTARGGELDGRLVRVTHLRVEKSESQAGDRHLTAVDPGGATLLLLLDRHAGITPAEPVTSGTILDATGILVPHGSTGEWVLKPRVASDLTVTAP